MKPLQEVTQQMSGEEYVTVYENNIPTTIDPDVAISVEIMKKI